MGVWSLKQQILSKLCSACSGRTAGSCSLSITTWIKANCSTQKQHCSWELPQPPKLPTPEEGTENGPGAAPAVLYIQSQLPGWGSYRKSTLAAAVQPRVCRLQQKQHSSAGRQAGLTLSCWLCSGGWVTDTMGSTSAQCQGLTPREGEQAGGSCHDCPALHCPALPWARAPCLPQDQILSQHRLRIFLLATALLPSFWEQSGHPWGCSVPQTALSLH